MAPQQQSTSTLPQQSFKRIKLNDKNLILKIRLPPTPSADADTQPLTTIKRIKLTKHLTLRLRTGRKAHNDMDDQETDDEVYCYRRVQRDRERLRKALGDNDWRDLSVFEDNGEGEREDVWRRVNLRLAGKETVWDTLASDNKSKKGKNSSVERNRGE